MGEDGVIYLERPYPPSSLLKVPAWLRVSSFGTERWAIKLFWFLNFCLPLVKRDLILQSSEDLVKSGGWTGWHSSVQLISAELLESFLLSFGRNGALSKLQREGRKGWQTQWEWVYQSNIKVKIHLTKRHLMLTEQRQRHVLLRSSSAKRF